MLPALLYVASSIYARSAFAASALLKIALSYEASGNDAKFNHPAKVQSLDRSRPVWEPSVIEKYWAEARTRFAALFILPAEYVAVLLLVRVFEPALSAALPLAWSSFQYEMRLSRRAMAIRNFGR